MTHLTDRSYTLLLQGSLPPRDARALARHLEGSCTVCEEFLASRPAADAVDGLVEEALAALAPAGARGNDLEFARIERSLRQGAPRATPAPRRVVPAALAAALLAAGVAGLLLPRSGPEPGAWDGLKGRTSGPVAVPVRLRFVVVTPAGGGAPALERGVAGQAIPSGASLQFEIEAGRTAQAALVRVPARGAPELFWSERVPAGRSGVTAGGRPAAYPLAALSGPQRFVLVASDATLEPARVAAAAAALAPPARVTADLPSLDGLSLDVLDVEVR